MLAGLVQYLPSLPDQQSATADLPAAVAGIALPEQKAGKPAPMVIGAVQRKAGRRLIIKNKHDATSRGQQVLNPSYSNPDCTAAGSGSELTNQHKAGRRMVNLERTPFHYDQLFYELRLRGAY